MAGRIGVRGAREHNLQAVDVSIPLGHLTVVTGVSGSGKSSLAFDTIFREAQRRYLAALSGQARLFLERQHRPLADGFDDLPPALAVDQRTTVCNPRSTVGTLTEVYDHLRLLFARLGTAEPPLDAPIGTHTFSFNSPGGACPTCQGLAVQDRVDPELLVKDPGLTLRQGALVPTTKSGYIVYSQVTVEVLDQVCRAHGFDVDTPWRDLTPDQQRVILYGSKALKVPFGKHPLSSRMRWSGITARPREEGYYKGLLPTIQATLDRNRNPNVLRFVRSLPCRDCGGSRLGEGPRRVRVAGAGITELVGLPLDRLRSRLAALAFDPAAAAVARPILTAVDARLRVLLELGLGHLCLGRGSTSLSGGEAQRIRLAAQVGSGLRGLLYVLDEPSIGLHPVDGERLLAVLHELRDAGNTVLCVEHDALTIRSADHLVDLGPGPGRFGGRVVYEGPPDPPPGTTVHASRTLSWLREPPPRRTVRDAGGTGHALVIRGATAHNLQGVDACFELGRFHLVTGVSGAGKSTLVDGILARALRQRLHGATALPGAHLEIAGVEHVAKVVHIDQAPIGRTPRSNPATYTGVFDGIRDLFAKQPEAIGSGLGKGHFSMNVKDAGRCETCQGAGHLVIGMHGLADVEIRCADCAGQRFGAATLAVRFRGHHIAEVLELPVDRARELFAGIEAIERVLAMLERLGLGYLTLGQSATTLSGGEAQRIKLAGELARPPGRGHTVYILDEPTTGLHGDDVRVLLDALQGLVDQGQTVIVIEHELAVIAAADRVLDLGPGAGAAGGRVVFAGTPEQLAACEASATGRALAGFLRDGHLAAVRTHPPATAAADRLELRGVTTHNLRGVDVTIPHRALTVITGVSGSGKSSLAFDTIFAEGRRRFAENLATRARRHLPRQTEARFEHIAGLTPVLAIDQRRGAANRRSTVGTRTGIHDLYRILYSRAGTPDGLSARMFSFNHQEGACPHCGGTGSEEVCDPDKLVTHPDRSLFDGAMDGHRTGRYYGERGGQHLAILAAVERELGLDLHRPYRELHETERRVAMFGCGDRRFAVTWEFARGRRRGVHRFEGEFPGLARYVDEEYGRKKLDHRGEAMRALLVERPCPECGGHRLREAPRAVTFCGVTLGELTGYPVERSIRFFRDEAPRRMTARETAITAQAREEVLRRLGHLLRLGLPYLALDRPTATLSGGELQRVRLAAGLGTRIAGVTYVLDEPTAGLHPHDTANLLTCIEELRGEDCTVIVVEHDPQVWAAADHVIALGPGGGPDGGRVVAQGRPDRVPPPRVRDLPKRPLPDRGRIHVAGAHRHNLRHLEVSLPIGGLVAITGVSGSGKSTLAFEVIAASLARGRAVGCERFACAEPFDAVVRAHQHPAGRSFGSTTATWIGIFDGIRRAFAATATAKDLGLSASAFSTTGKSGGRCPECEGRGAIRTSMDFLPDVFHPCETCGGRRYTAEVLRCELRGRDIAGVLGLTVRDALAFFADDRAIAGPLAHLDRIGLGYLELGQPADTLSGGEVQRLVLATELGRADTGRRLCLLDEPTTGLHASDVDRLLPILRELTDAGHTVVVVEHDAGVIRNADWVVDLGPGGGEDGGTLLFSGPPADLGGSAGSRTALYLG